MTSSGKSGTAQLHPCEECGAPTEPGETYCVECFSVPEADFDRQAEAYNRKVLGHEFDLLEIEQRADEAMRDD